MRSPRGILALGLTVCLLAGAGGGCALQSSRRTLTTAPPAPTLDGRPAFMKAHLKDGSLLVFSDWRVDEPTGRLLGMAERFNLNRTSVASGPMSVPLDSLAICEANVLQTSPAVAGLTILSVATAGMTAYCIADPKSCFGSCPTFYAPGEDGAPLLQAEGFSASVAPSLEAGDLDQLTRCRAKGNRFELAMTNEALETHVVRYVELLTVPRAPGGRVFATATGDFHATTAPMAPIHATAIEGDVTALLAAADGRERFSLADGDDLAAREIIDLTFDAPPAGPLGLVLTSRQSLLSTYLFYQGLAFLGDRAAPALAHARQVLEPADGGGTLGGLLGRIAVAVVDTDGVWVAAGSVGETGPLAPNTHVVIVPEGAARPLRVRLELARGCWRLDQTALVQLQGPAAARRLAPVEVRRDGDADPNALARLLDQDQTLVTFPGDRYTLVFDLPADAADLELFVESRGYYLEWMRREWAADQDPARAARMLVTPAVMLRELAQAFKERESAMEAQFWGSRYAR
jgi:hypothetical protein